LETDINGCIIPGTEKNGKYAVKMPSFLAVLDSNAQVEGEENIKMLQYFATGKSATELAKDEQIRESILRRIDPEFDLVTHDSNDPTVACIEAWLNGDRNRPPKLQKWWEEKGIPGIAALGITGKKYKNERKAFITEENINCDNAE